MAWTADRTTNTALAQASAPRRRLRWLLSAGLVTLAAGLMAAAIAAAADPVPVPGVPGITAPAGLARDTNGDLWVADSGGGVCRLLDPPFAPFEGMVCPPKELQGPKSPGQMALDPSSGSVFVGDAAAAGGAVWRLHLDQTADPAVIDSATLLVDLPADRVLGMAYNVATGALHYSTKDSPAIRRIEDAATCAAPCVATTVGAAVAKGARSLAHDGDGRLYLADVAGVTRIETLGVGAAQAQPVPGFDGSYDALAFDPAAEADGHGRIYAGTNNPTGADWIDVLRVSDDALVSRYSMGFAAVTAIGIDTRDVSDRALDVADDPSAKQVGEDTVGAGRRLTVPFERFERPTIIDAPPSVTNVSDVTFGFTSPTDTTFWCSLDGGPAQPCGSGFAASRDYLNLTDGDHVFQVQTDNTITGGRARHAFEVDTRAPIVTLGALIVAGASAHISFVADDVSADFACSIDGAAAASCDSPAVYTGLAPGEHTFAVTAIDFAGNAGTPVSALFTIVAPAVMVPPVVTPLVAIPPVVTPPVVVHSGPVAPWKPGLISATLRGRTLRVAFDVPPGARYVRFTMTRKSASSVSTSPVRVTDGKRNVVQIVLTRQMAQRLQGKRFTVTIYAGATQKRLTTSAGKAPLRIVAALQATTGRTR